MPETVNIVELTHPVLAPLAIATIPARHNLLRNGQVSQFQSIFLAGSLAQRDHLAENLMPED